MRSPLNQVPAFLLYLEWRDKLEMLSDAQRGKLLLALFYHLEGKPLPSGMSTITKVAFAFIIGRVEAEQERYRNICQLNREKALKRWAKHGQPPDKPRTPAQGGHAAACTGNAVACTGNAAADSAMHTNPNPNPNPNPKLTPNPKRNPKAPARAPDSSFDVDEFFAKALAKSYGKPPDKPKDPHP